MALFYLTGLFVAGLLLLAISADCFVVQVATLARMFRIPPLWVGIVLMGFATTVPEFLVSFVSAHQQHGGLALGNILGSYIANIDLVLGLCILLSSMRMAKHVLRVDVPIMLLGVLLAAVLLYDNYFGIGDGIILLCAFAAYIGYLIWSVWHQPKNQVDEIKATMPSVVSANTWMKVRMGFILLISFLGMCFGSEWMVDSASKVAVHFGVSNLVVGLTVVSIGTSLPELAASLASVRRGEYALAMGNVLGSNIMTILGVMSVPALMLPGPQSFDGLKGYLLLMFLSTLLLASPLLLAGKKEVVTFPRWSGIVFLALFIAYLLWVGIQEGFVVLG